MDSVCGSFRHVHVSIPFGGTSRRCTHFGTDVGQGKGWGVAMFQRLIDPLERRAMLSRSPTATTGDLSELVIRDGVLRVSGTHKDDRITITRSTVSISTVDDISHSGAGLVITPITIGDGRTLSSSIVIQTARHSYLIDASLVTKIIVNGGAGDDTI